MDTRQQNIDTIKRFLDEVWNQGSEAAIDELYAPHGSAKGIGDEFQSGPEQFKAFHRLMHNTCANIRVMPVVVMGDGDAVVYHSIFELTHRATGQKVRMEAGGSARLKDGRIIEAHNVVNFLDMLIAIGAVPADILPQALLGGK